MAGFADFIKHRKYFVCVSPATLGWYEYCFGLIPENPSQADLQNAVIAMRERGIEAHGNQQRNYLLECLRALACVP